MPKKCKRKRSEIVENGLTGDYTLLAKLDIFPPPLAPLPGTYHRKKKGKKTKPVYSIAFNARRGEYFAATCLNRVRIYRIFSTTHKIHPVAPYVDPNTREHFYACVWAYDPITDLPWLVIGGELGVISIIDVSKACLVRRLRGHIGPVHDLKIHPKNPSILLSTSGDCSARIWDLSTGNCLLQFSGQNGHKNQVLSGDFHLDGMRIVTGSMDNTVKIWDLTPYNDLLTNPCSPGKKPENSTNPSKNKEPKIRSGGEDGERKDTKTFYKTPRQIHYPNFSTQRVHRNYVDCVMFFSDWVLSKSTENEIVLWKPHYSKEISYTRVANDDISDAAVFRTTNCKIWYIRFAVDSWMKYLAVGNVSGEVKIWNIQSKLMSPAAVPEQSPVRGNERDDSLVTTLKSPGAVPIRNLAFSPQQNHRYILCGTDDGKVLVWKRKNWKRPDPGLNTST
ncbi:hypothetical protein AAMO2058_000324300 [Amorphochlora amoebiformis]